MGDANENSPKQVQCVVIRRYWKDFSMLVILWELYSNSEEISTDEISSCIGRWGWRS
jgi:hypothetical protein